MFKVFFHYLYKFLKYLGLFAVLRGLKIAIQLKNDRANKINIETKCDFPQQIFLRLRILH